MCFLNAVESVPWTEIVQKAFGINFGYQLYVIVKILKSNMVTGAKNAVFYLFLSKAFILCTLMLAFQKDQIGKLLDLVGGFFGFNSRAMNGKSVEIYLSGI